MADRREMQPDDWIDAAFKVVIGMLLGSIADWLIELATSELWPVAVFVLIIILGILLFEFVIDKLSILFSPILYFFDSILKAIIDLTTHGSEQTVNIPEKKGRMPLVVFLSFPIGLIIGVILSRLGLDNAIIELLK